MADLIDLDNLPPAPPEMGEYLALAKTLALLERICDTLVGGCMGAGAMTLLAGSPWGLVFMAGAPLLTCLVIGARWYGKRKAQSLADAMMERDE